MAQTDHTHTTEEMATSTSYTYTFQGFQTENYTTKIQSYQDILYLDGKSVISDGALSLGTSTNNPVYLGADSTAYIKLETDGTLNILSGKLSINSDTGSVGQVLSTDGNGNLSWLTVDYTQFAFSNIAVSGETTVQASSTSDTLTSTVTIASDTSAHNAFKYMAPLDGAGYASGSQIEADSQSDTLTFVAGSGMTLTFDENNDKITFAATQTGDANQNAFSSISVSGQSTLGAAQASETVTFDSSTDRNELDITTDTANKKVTFKAKLPRTLSMSGRIPTRLSDGSISGMPLKNHFFNQTVSGVNVSGGGSSVGFSARAVVCKEADGTTHKLTMPASGDNSLLFTVGTDSSGTSLGTLEVDMTESNL